MSKLNELLEVPFDAKAFREAVVEMFGRAPDAEVSAMGRHSFQYRPMDFKDRHTLQVVGATLKLCFAMFDIDRYESYCCFGQLAGEEEEGLDILIVERKK
jgi:hypothetical protein